MTRRRLADWRARGAARRARPFDPADLEPDRQLIVPRVRAAVDIERMAALARADGHALLEPEPLAANLVVVYAFDRPDAFQMVMRDDLSTLGLARSELRAVAVENMARLTGGGLSALQVDGLRSIGSPFAAASLLWPELWDQIADSLGAEPVVGVFRTDIVMACPIDDLETVSLLAAMLADRKADRALCEDPLIRADEGWVRLDDE